MPIDLYASSDIGEDFDSWDEETDEVFDEYKPLIQHFVLENPWLPYEKDLRLNKFVIHQNNSVDLEFDIIFNRPPHLRNEPSDLNDPLNVLRRFYSLMGKSDVDGNNIKCSIIDKKIAHFQEKKMNILLNLIHIGLELNLKI